MPWKPAQGPQLLAPFDHQVAGQSSMLRYDSSTVCKPLISRENFVYKTLPDELKEFTPEYRGEIEVEMVERDGYIELYGMTVQDNSEGVPLCYCSKESQQASPRKTNGNLLPDESAACKETDEAQALPGNSCVIRVLRSGSYEVCPSTQEVFYTKDSSVQHPRTQNLNPWSLKNHKRLLDKMRKSQHNHHTVRFMMLKNVVAKLKHPCVLDLKIGSRLHGDDASKKKVASQSKKCSETTSSTLGVRLCGMQVYQVNSGVYRSHDKYHGRTLTDHSFKETLREFLNNGVRFRSDLLEPVISRLSQLIHCLQGLNSFRFYASSLLIMYDGEDSELNGDGQCKILRGESKSVVEGEGEQKTVGNLEERIGKIQMANITQDSSHKQAHCEGCASSSVCLHQNHQMLQDGKDDVETLLDEPVNNSSNNNNNNNNSFQHSNLRTSSDSEVEHVTEYSEMDNDNSAVHAFQSYSNVVNSSTSRDHPVLKREKCSHPSLFNGSHLNDKSAINLPRIISRTLEKVDVQMIDFAHTTHKGFIEDSHKHIGPDVDYIQGLSNLVLLFQHLKHESESL